MVNYISVLFIDWLYYLQSYKQGDAEGNQEQDQYTQILQYLNTGFTVMFTIECTLKLLGFGRVRTAWDHGNILVMDADSHVKKNIHSIVEYFAKRIFTI